MFPLKHQRQNLLLKRIPSTKIMLNRILTAKQLLLFFKEFLTVYNSTAYQLCPLQKTVSEFSFLVLLITDSGLPALLHLPQVPHLHVPVIIPDHKYHGLVPQLAASLHYIYTHITYVLFKFLVHELSTRCPQLPDAKLRYIT